MEALRDNCGKRKNPDEMTELEQLRAEVKILRAEKEHAEMETSFLKNSRRQRGGGAKPAPSRTYISGN